MNFLRGALGRSLWHAIVALTAMAVVAGATVFLVEYAAGDFASTYRVTGAFSSAGEGLHPGSEVVERGVEIGTVKSISLSHGMAQVTMAIGDQFKLPSNVHASIRSENLFGAEQVVMEESAHPAATNLRDGSTLQKTYVEDQLGQLFATASPLLQKLDTTDLAAVISELAAAARGQGPAIKAALNAGTRFADLLSQTSVAQLRALDAFARFTEAIAATGPAINTISARSNQALPLFNQASSTYHQLLGDVSALADNVTRLLSDYRPDIATILNQGGNVVRVLIADRPQLEQVITGLYQYALRFGHASDGAMLPDGSQVGYFKTFIDWVNVEQLVCGLIAPAVPGLSFLAPLQQAVSQIGGPLDCSGQIKKFNAVQNHPGAGAAPSSASPSPTAALGGATSAAGLGKTGQQLTQQLYQQVAAPQSAPASTSLASYLAALLGSSSSSGPNG